MTETVRMRGVLAFPVEVIEVREEVSKERRKGYRIALVFDVCLRVQQPLDLPI